MSSGSKSSRPASSQRTAIASLKPIFSNALFHSRMPSSTYGRYSIGTVSSTYQTICFLGGESLAAGFGLLEPPAVDHADEVRVGVGDAEVLGRAQEVADAVVGRARAVAEIGRLHQAVVDDHA